MQNTKIETEKQTVEKTQNEKKIKKFKKIDCLNKKRQRLISKRNASLPLSISLSLSARVNQNVFMTYFCQPQKPISFKCISFTLSHSLRIWSIKWSDDEKKITESM